MRAVAGKIRDNKLILDNDNLSLYDGRDVILTILDKKTTLRSKKRDWSSIEKLVRHTDRAERAVEYVRELRDNDRF